MSSKNIIYHSDRCCNPYSVSPHKGNNLRSLSGNLRKSFPDFPGYAKICSSCRQSKLKNTNSSVSSSSLCNNLSQSTSKSMDVDHSITNESFCSTESFTPSDREIELESMLNGLKDKFTSLKINDPLRLRILTIAPDTWSSQKIADEFKCSWNFAKKSKELKVSGGVLADTKAKTGRPLSDDSVQKVIDFYNDNSRIMGGMKDVKSVKTDNGRNLVQKHLLHLDLRGLYAIYKETYKELSVSFSKFAQLRPKNCILPGGKGTHTVCVCTIHENSILMLDAIDIQKLTENSKCPILNYKDCLKQITCENSTEKCYLDECEKCRNLTNFKEYLQELLAASNILEVEFTAWTGTDRSTLLTQILPSNDFVEELCDKLVTLKPHSFISRKQAEFFKTTKKNLKVGEFLIVLDFSENYKYVVQKASQAFHFNNDQCTVFPVVYYYLENSEIVHKSIVFISDYTKHDTAAVYTIQKILLPYLKLKHKPKKLIYFSDGAKQHFKNKYGIINLVHHEMDFGIKAEWHMHATAHGKAASDGIGGTFKREAVRYSLQCKPKEAILTAQKLYEWAETHYANTKTFYYSKNDHQKMVKFLNKRFQSALAVPQITKNHAFFVENKKLLIKRFSSDKNSTELQY